MCCTAAQQGMPAIICMQLGGCGPGRLGRTCCTSKLGFFFSSRNAIVREDVTRCNLLPAPAAAVERHVHVRMIAHNKDGHAIRATSLRVVMLVGDSPVPGSQSSSFHEVPLLIIRARPACSVQNTS